MRENISTTLVKIFVVAISALILTLAAFGVGFSVGMNYSMAVATAPAPANRALDRNHATSEPAMTPPPAASTPSPASSPETDNPLDVQLFLEAWQLLQNQFYGDLPKGEEITYNAIRGLVEHLGDRNTAFLDPQQAVQFNAELEGNFEGVGARVEEAEGGGVLITYLFPEQPAEKAGLRVGDVITAVDGRDVTHLSLLDAISLIRGPRDTEVVLTVRREDQSPFEVKVVRARIEIPVVQTQWLADGKVAYVALSEFSSNAPARLADALNEMLRKKPVGLILDLRGDPGGFLEASVRIGSYFVPEGDITIERFRDGTERVYQRDGKYLLGEIPLVVLVDAGSASASEIVAGAIQDAGTGVLIGEKTFGKGSVQQPNTLSDGSQLRITVAHWFTPKGRGINEAGLEPDIVVSITPEDAEAKRDPQLERAVEYVLKGK